jgi:hypothetical protein
VDSYKTQNFILRHPSSPETIRASYKSIWTVLVRRLSRRSSMASGRWLSRSKWRARGYQRDHISPRRGALNQAHARGLCFLSVGKSSTPVGVTKRSSCALFSSPSSFNRGCFSTVCIGASDSKFPTFTRVLEHESKMELGTR